MTWESDHVESLRARGVPWPHVAAQVGKNEIDIRRRYDPALRTEAVIQSDAPPDAKTGRTFTGNSVRPAEYRSRFDPESKVGRALALLADGPLPSTRLSALIEDWTTTQASKAMNAQTRKGFVTALYAHQHRLWRITEAGRALLEHAR